MANIAGAFDKDYAEFKKHQELKLEELIREELRESKDFLGSWDTLRKLIDELERNEIEEQSVRSQNNG